MPSYFDVPNCLCDANGVSQYLNRIPSKAIKSTIHATNKGSDNVYCEYNSRTTAVKNQGNLVKQGSGGNSYDAYIKRKKGNLRNC